MSENTVFKEYHEDGIKLFNKTMNMKQVVNELRDPKHRILNEDVEPGQPVRAQLAATMSGIKQISQKMKGKAFVIETKFDGERMQVHKKGDTVHYYSRNGLDHGEQSGYTLFNAALAEQVKAEEYILDCEIVAWNKRDMRFEPFGGLKSAFKMANESSDSNSRLEMTEVYRRSSVVEHDPEYEAPALQDIEIICVAFDVLHNGKESVIHKSLVDRHAILSEMVSDTPEAGVQLGSSAVRGRVFALVPYRRFLNAMPVSKVSRNEEDIQEAFDSALRGQDEGIMVKDLESRWVANDRKGAWMKLKPDHAFVSEIDAVVIGGHFGTGRRRGEIAEYLLALAEKPGLGQSKPSTFISMCRVGTGVSDEERKQISDKLKPLFLEATVKRANNPKCYKVTGHNKERPDVWISDPFKSVVLEVLADIRLITSSVFATQQSLRFPRVQKIRWDKDAADIQTHDDFLEQAEARREGPGEGRLQRGKKRKAAKGKEPKTALTVASTLFAPVDVSQVQRKSDILRGAKLEVLSFGQGEKSRDAISKLIKELGGQMYMNMTPAVTHFLSEKPDHYQVSIRMKKNYDVLTLDWLLDIAKAGKMISACPRHYIFLTKETRNQHPAFDRCGDLHTEDSTVADAKALLQRHITRDDADPKFIAPSSSRSSQYTATDAVVDVEKELTSLGYPTPLSSLFRGCCCVYLSLEADDDDETIALHSLKSKYLHLLVKLCGGRVSEKVEEGCTHLILEDWQGDIDCSGILRRIRAAGGIESLENFRNRLKSSLSIVKSSWVTSSYRSAEIQASKSEAVQREAESRHTHPALKQAGPSSWPWEEFGIDINPKKKRKADVEVEELPKKRGRAAGKKPTVRRPQQRRVQRGTFKVGAAGKRASNEPKAENEGKESEEQEDSGVDHAGPQAAAKKRQVKRRRGVISETDAEPGSEVEEKKQAPPSRSRRKVSKACGRKLREGVVKSDSSESQGNIDEKEADENVTHDTEHNASQRDDITKQAEPAHPKEAAGRVLPKKNQGTSKSQGEKTQTGTRAAAGKADSGKPKSALLRAHLESSDEDSDAPQEDADLTFQEQATGDQQQRAEDGIEIDDGKNVKKADDPSAMEMDKPEPRANSAETDAVGNAETEVGSQIPAESTRQATQVGSSQHPPGKKLTLRERMALRGISIKK